MPPRASLALPSARARAPWTTATSASTRDGVLAADAASSAPSRSAWSSSSAESFAAPEVKGATRSARPGRRGQRLARAPVLVAQLDQRRRQRGAEDLEQRERVALAPVEGVEGVAHALHVELGPGEQRELDRLGRATLEDGPARPEELEEVLVAPGVEVAPRGAHHLELGDGLAVEALGEGPVALAEELRLAQRVAHAPRVVLRAAQRVAARGPLVVPPLARRVRGELDELRLGRAARDGRLARREDGHAHRLRLVGARLGGDRRRQRERDEVVLADVERARQQARPRAALAVALRVGAPFGDEDVAAAHVARLDGDLAGELAAERVAPPHRDAHLARAPPVHEARLLARAEGADRRLRRRRVAHANRQGLRPLRGRVREVDAIELSALQRAEVEAPLAALREEAAQHVARARRRRRRRHLAHAARAAACPPPAPPRPTRRRGRG